MKRHFAASALSAVAFIAAGVVPAGADGYEFFTVDRGRKANLVYVGQIRDKDSGQIVREPAYFMVTEKRSGMTFPFVNDRPGHYRSPDIGESVEELAGTTVNPSDLDFELVIDGYKKVTSATVPKRSKGIVEVNFKVERDGSATSTGADKAPDGATPGATSASASRAVDMSVRAEAAQDPADVAGSRWFRLVFMAVAVVAIIAGAAARTSGLRRSTAR